MKKPSVAMLVMSKKKPEPGKEEGEDLDALMEAKKEAAADLADAVKGGDADAVAEAFTEMYDLCVEAHNM